MIAVMGAAASENWGVDQRVPGRASKQPAVWPVID